MRGGAREPERVEVGRKKRVKDHHRTHRTEFWKRDENPRLPPGKGRLAAQCSPEREGLLSKKKLRP